MSTTEERIAAALSATAGGVTMDTSTIDKRFAEVRDRGVQQRRTRRRVMVGAGALAVAASVVAALAFGGGLWDSDDTAVPEFAEPPQQQEAAPATGEGFPLAGSSYSPQGFPQPLTFTVPDKGEVFGQWRYDAGQQLTLNLDNSPSTGHAMIVFAVPEQVYDPTLPKPFTGDQGLVAAPEDADDWERWLEATGAVEVTDRAELEVDGVPATRFSLDVADDLPESGFPCAPEESCLALAPDGPSVAGAGRFGQVLSELTVLDVEGPPVVAVALGLEESASSWLPLMRSTVESLRFG